ELDVAGREEERVAAELERADLEGDARAGRALLEDHGERLAGERLAAVLAELDAPGEVEDVVELVGAEVRDLEEIALLGHGRQGLRRCHRYGAAQSTGAPDDGQDSGRVATWVRRAAGESGRQPAARLRGCSGAGPRLRRRASAARGRPRR